MVGAKTLRWIPFWSQSLFFTIYSFHKSETAWLRPKVSSPKFYGPEARSFKCGRQCSLELSLPWYLINILQYYTVNNINFMWFFETDMFDIVGRFKVIIGQRSESEIHQRDLINFDIFFFLSRRRIRPSRDRRKKMTHRTFMRSIKG